MLKLQRAGRALIPLSFLLPISLTLCLSIGVQHSKASPIQFQVQEQGNSPQEGRSDFKPATSKLVVTAVDLTGTDHELGKFLTDSIITDFSQSTVLQPLERATVQESMNKLKLSLEGPLSAGDVRKLGASTEADRVLVGSFLLRDELLTINVRMLDAHTGLVIPGGALSTNGSRKQILYLVHQVARRLHKKLTDTELIVEDAEVLEKTDHNLPASGTVTGEQFKPSSVSLPTAIPVDDLRVLKSQGLVPATAKPNATVTAPELQTLVKAVSKCITSEPNTAAQLTQTTMPVTRIRALAALIKLMVAPDDLANYHLAPPQAMPADTTALPAWGVPYLAAAVDQGWWPAGRAIAGKDPATWSFVCTLLTRLPLHLANSPVGDPPVVSEFASAGTARPVSLGSSPDDEPYTGLVIDALDLRIERAMGPRIVDESGKVVYPDAGHVPSEDYILDHGMVSYYYALTDARRAGKHPLVIHASRVSDLGHDDITVSNEAAELIREANRRGKFLWKWNVAILDGGKKQGVDPLVKEPEDHTPHQNPPMPPQ